MAWCRQATSHYLNHCWPRSLSPYGATRPQWVNILRNATGHLICFGILLIRFTNLSLYCTCMVCSIVCIHYSVAKWAATEIICYSIVYSTIQINTELNTKALPYWPFVCVCVLGGVGGSAGDRIADPLWGESIGDRWIPLIRASKVFHAMTSLVRREQHRNQCTVAMIAFMSYKRRWMITERHSVWRLFAPVNSRLGLSPRWSCIARYQSQPESWAAYFKSTGHKWWHSLRRLP